MEKNELIDVLKNRLAETVERKRENTRQRLAYKKATPIEDPVRFSTLTRFWCQGSSLKDEIRVIGLAYAFLRGRRYWVTERVVARPADAHGIAWALGDSSREEEIEIWLAEEPSGEERSAFEAHLKVSKEKALAAYRARSTTRRAA